MKTKLIFSTEVPASQTVACEIRDFPKEAQKGDHFRAKFLGRKTVAVIDRREWVPCSDVGFKSFQEETLCIYCIVDREVFDNLLCSAKVINVAPVVKYEIPLQNWCDPL